MTASASSADRSATGDGKPHIAVIGAGIAGLTAAYEFVRAGCRVEIVDRAESSGRGCSFYAGGMIAPWCEAESSEPELLALGKEGLRYWREVVPVALTNGSLLVAAPRDQPELTRFARRTSRHATLDAETIAALEPDLAGRFSRALFFADEAHLDPRSALAELTRRLQASGLLTVSLSLRNAKFRSDCARTVLTRPPAFHLASEYPTWV